MDNERFFETDEGHDPDEHAAGCDCDACATEPDQFAWDDPTFEWGDGDPV